MKNTKIVIGFLGEQGAGKGTIVEYIKDAYKATHFRFSQPLEDILDRLYIAKSRPNFARLVQMISRGFGDDFLAKTLLRDTEKEKNRLIVIEGIRRWPEVEILKRIPTFKMIFITAKEKTRYERIIKRGEKAGETELTFEQFKEQGKLHTEKLIKKIGQQADFQISNDGDLDELHANIESLMSKILPMK